MPQCKKVVNSCRFWGHTQFNLAFVYSFQAILDICFCNWFFLTHIPREKSLASRKRLLGNQEIIPGTQKRLPGTKEMLLTTYEIATMKCFLAFACTNSTLFRRGGGRPSKCLNHHNQQLCKLFLAGIIMLLQTYCVLLKKKKKFNFYSLFV